MPVNMALLQTFFPSLSSHSSRSLCFTSTPMCMLQRKTLNLQSKVFGGFGISTPSGFERRGALVVQASSGVDGVNTGGADPPPGVKEEGKSVEDLPLESKLQLKLEQKLRMKLAKKIRLKRKRLVQKRRLRKKGRWPPSKMKKNKNV